MYILKIKISFYLFKILYLNLNIYTSFPSFFVPFTSGNWDIVFQGPL